MNYKEINSISVKASVQIRNIVLYNYCTTCIIYRNNMFLLSILFCQSLAHDSFISVVHECESYCMVCASVREDNPRALESGLTPAQTLNNYLLIAPACICTLSDIRC